MNGNIFGSIIRKTERRRIYGQNIFDHVGTVNDQRVNGVIACKVCHDLGIVLCGKEGKLADTIGDGLIGTEEGFYRCKRDVIAHYVGDISGARTW